MVLQHIVWPEKMGQAEQELYYHAAPEIEIIEDGSIRVPTGGKITFDTYFNSFSGKTWLENTTVDSCDFRISVEGKGKVFLKTGESCVICEQEFNGNVESRIPLRHIGNELYYLEIQAEENVRILSGSIETSLEGRKIHLILVTCTYNRQEEIQKNVSLLRKKNKMPVDNELVLDWIYVVDNASNLKHEDITSDRVVLIANRNTGGAGGFTRGLQEAVKDVAMTHVLLMDDDVVIEFEAIVRTKSMLRYIKKEKEENFIGGAMFRRDVPYVLHAAGEIWNDGSIQNPYKNTDMRSLEAVKKVIEPLKLPQVYAGWWYCCIPRSHVEIKGYPMPFFLHVDDVEYSLRSGRTPIYLNGIAVWHEEFDDKRNSIMEYYDTRNRLITNAIYMNNGKKWNTAGILMERFLASVLRYRYKDVDLILQAAEDFLKGPDWLISLDAEEYHKELLNYGYKMQPVENTEVSTTEKNRSKAETLLRYLLPASGRGTIKVGALVGDYAGKKELLLVDMKGQKGLLVKKSWKETVKYAGRLIKEIIIVYLKYRNTEQKWKQEFIKKMK